MPITFGGLASGLPANIVDIIVESKRGPIKIVQTQKTQQESKLKYLSDLKTKVTSLNDTLAGMASFAALRELKARSSDESIINVTVDKERAKPGVYTLQVESLAKKASAMSCGFPDSDYTEVGIGYLVFDVEGEEQEIFIGEDNNTLEGIVNTINAMEMPIRAHIVEDEAAEEGEKFRMILASEGEGADKDFNFPNFYFMDGDIDFYFEEESEAGNGKIILDGFPVNINGNKLTNVVPGATLNLLDAKPGRNVSIIIEEDIEAVAAKVEDFITKVNGVFDFFESQFAINEDTDTSGMLAGDTSLQTLQYRLSRIIQSDVPGLKGQVKRLADAGISFNRGGKLEFSKDKFLAAANEDFKGVSDLFSARRDYENEDGDIVRMDGVVTKLYQNLKDTLYGNGILAIKEKSLREKIRNLDKQIERKEQGLEQTKINLQQQFAKMEQSMSQIKAQQAQMQQQMGSIPMNSAGMLAGKFAG